MNKRKRSNQIFFRVDDKEKEIILQKFKLSGFKTFREFCCHMLIFGRIFKVDLDELIKINYEISKIGTNINQIAHRVNMTENIYKEDIEEIKSKLTNIENLIKYYEKPFFK